MFKHLITFLIASLFTISVSAQTPAPKKEEPKAPTPAVKCEEKDKNGKAIIDAKTGKPVVCPKVEEKKK